MSSGTFESSAGSKITFHGLGLPHTLSLNSGLLPIYVNNAYPQNWGHTLMNFLFFKKRLYLFLGRREGREKERERNINVWLPLTLPLLGTWPATHECTLTGNQTGDPLGHRPVLNPLSHTRQGKFS